MSATPVVSVITDEVSLDPAVFVDFMVQHQVATVDIRAVDGRNVILFDDAALDALSAQLRDAGLAVSCYCSPLLKWPRPGHEKPGEAANFHGFDPGDLPPEKALPRAFEVANRLGAPRLRIFSYLRYKGFAPEDLDDDLDRLIALADAHDVTLLLENEHVCNAITLADITAICARRDHPRLKGVLDIANHMSPNHTGTGHPAPSDDEVAAAARIAGGVHVKDFNARHRYVPLGQGIVPQTAPLATILAHAPTGPLPVSIETHMPSRGAAATAASLEALRGMIERV